LPATGPWAAQPNVTPNHDTPTTPVQAPADTPDWLTIFRQWGFEPKFLDAQEL
jgi:hypothetical protein